MSGSPPGFQFDDVDWVQVRLLQKLQPGQRLRVMLDARELVVGLIRGQLCRRYPDLSEREINLKLLEELDRGR
jgi:hypothetical protein